MDGGMRLFQRAGRAIDRGIARMRKKRNWIREKTEPEFIIKYRRPKAIANPALMASIRDIGLHLCAQLKSVHEMRGRRDPSFQIQETSDYLLSLLRSYVKEECKSMDHLNTLMDCVGPIEIRHRELSMGLPYIHNHILLRYSEFHRIFEDEVKNIRSKEERDQIEEKGPYR
jgi:hypothetical protein